MRPHQGGRWPYALLVALLVLLAPPGSAQSALPSGFGGIEVGAKWEDLEGSFAFESLASVSSPWDRHARECGFRYLRLEADTGELLITVNDGVVTDVVYVTPLEADADVVAVADLVMQSYGQPERASMRNALGQVTIDRDDVSYVTLEYARPRPVEFSIAGPNLWEYRIRVRFEHHRWHENRTLRCTRERDKAVPAG